MSTTSTGQPGRRVWLVTTGEALPIDPGARVMRTGRIARLMAAGGHQVTWWADAFDHYRKTFRAAAHECVTVQENLNIALLHAPPYYRNISLARVWNHRCMAAQFRLLAPRRERPDVILCSYPPIELALAVADFASQQGVPLIMDVRDYWPDIFPAYLPRWTRWPARLMLRPYYAMSKAALRQALAFTAISEDILRWGLERAGRGRGAGDRVFYNAYWSEPPGAVPPEPLDLGAGLPRPALRCAFIGGFGVGHDLATIIEAAHKLRGSAPAVQFVLAGDGNLAQALRKQAQGLLNVVFTGWISAPQIQSLLSQADAGLVSFTAGCFEAVPNKIFEYMSGGLALLNTTTSDMRPVIEREKIGLNYEAGNATELAEKIQYLLAHPEELAAMRRRSKELFLEKFEARKVYQDMIAHVLSFARSAKT